MLDWLSAPTWHFARSILNTTPGYSNSGSMRPDFEIGGSGGIRARRRPRGDTELLPRCNEAARRTQRRRLVRLASAQRPLGGWQSRAAGWSRGVECCPGRCGNVVRDSTACLQCEIKRKSRRAQRCRRAPSRPRSDRFGGWQGCERLAGLAASSVALDVAAMSLVFQLRVCSAHSIMIAVLHVVFSILSELSCLSRAVRAW